MREMLRQRAITHAAVFISMQCRMNIHFALGSLLYNHQPNCGPSRIMFTTAFMIDHMHKQCTLQLYHLLWVSSHVYSLAVECVCVHSNRMANNAVSPCTDSVPTSSVYVLG